MYNQGLKPVHRTGTSKRWERLSSEVTHSCGEGKDFNIKFRFKFTGSSEPTFFAFSYPYSFEEAVAKIDDIEHGCTPPSTKAEGVYFKREVATRSLEVWSPPKA